MHRTIAICHSEVEKPNSTGPRGHAAEAAYHYGLVADTISQGAPEYQDPRVDDVEKRFEEAFVKADVGVGNVVIVLSHLGNVGEYGVECKRLHHSHVAQQGNLEPGPKAACFEVHLRAMAGAVVVVIPSERRRYCAIVEGLVLSLAIIGAWGMGRRG